MFGELGVNILTSDAAGHASAAVLGYIDAGSGSYLLAAIASGAAGMWFFVRSKMSRLTRRKGDAPEAEPTPTDQ
jgi:hypothetical protein